MRTAVKRLVMWAYCRGYMPASVVRVFFRVLRLRHE